MVSDLQANMGVLLSGGVDSAVLLAHLLEKGWVVQPFYVQSDLFWERCELPAARRFLQHVACGRLKELITLQLPVGDLYGDHWSITGRGAPAASSPDEAVFLPGRNVLLVVKAALWCQLHGVEQLALAPLGSSPFADATGVFFDRLQAALGCAIARPLRIVRPFAEMTKQEVMHLGRDYPLEFTFSCISPQDGLHCGRCNKCGERRRAFDLSGRKDPTHYAHQPDCTNKPCTE